MIKFHKYEATGNDFILIENLKECKNDEIVELVTRICNRHYGIGADGVLLLYNTQHKNYLRIFNADGSEASMCGNGLRCCALHIINELFAENKFSIHTLSGEKTISIEKDLICVNLGVPRIIKTFKDVLQRIQYTLINVGNLHAVVEVDDVRSLDLEEIVKKNFKTKQFNITFVSLGMKKDSLNVRVYERGVGETLSCGSGSVAAYFYMRNLNKVGRRAEINLPGGNLIVKEGNNKELILQGPATFIFKGEFSDE